jgi:N-acetylneuraminic acid mutarotase
LIGDDFVIVSGFGTNGWNSVTKKVYAFNVRETNAKWREMDEVPVEGFSHASYAVDGMTMYICGAYSGPLDTIKDSPVCLKYSHTAPKGQQWSRLPDMPDGRGGGGLNHIKETNSLVYANGATRPPTEDRDSTWELDLDNQLAGWVNRAPTQYKGNHISHVTAYYEGRPRYYYLGGQLEQNEANGNQNDVMEWDQASKSWIRRANMLMGRGHASSSTLAYGCGFIIIAGAINGGDKTSDISYYAIDTDSWTKIGDLPENINTPVCDIVRNLSGSDWVYCQTGPISGTFAYKSKISL